MGKVRLADFSDGVIAIVITIMVLELKVPHGAGWHALSEVVPHFMIYMLSFIYLAIYWNNHHHRLHTVTRVDGLILWANANLLFWLSLIPVATGVARRKPAVIHIDRHLRRNLVGSGNCIVAAAGDSAPARQAVGARARTGSRPRGKLTPFLYLAAVGLAFAVAWISIAIYVSVAIIWLVPDCRVEKVLPDT